MSTANIETPCKAHFFAHSKIGCYQEEEHVVVVRAVLEVHAESSVHVAQVVMVIQLSEGRVGQLCTAVEAFEQVVAWDEVQVR